MDMPKNLPPESPRVEYIHSFCPDFHGPRSFHGPGKLTAQVILLHALHPAPLPRGVLGGSYPSGSSSHFSTAIVITLTSPTAAIIEG